MKSPIPSKYLGVTLLMFIGVLVLSERLLWTQGARTVYPSFLVSPAPAGAHDVMSLRDACGDSVEVAPLNQQEALVRCGDLWPVRSVWRVPAEFVSR